MFKNILLILLLAITAGSVKAQDSLYCEAIVLYVESDIPTGAFDLTAAGSIVPLVFKDNVYFTDNYLTLDGNISFFRTDYEDQGFVFSVKVMPAVTVHSWEKASIKLTGGGGLGYIIGVKADQSNFYRGISYPVGGAFQFFHWGRGDMIGFALGNYYYILPDHNNLNSVTLTLLYSFLTKERCRGNNIRIRPIFAR